MRLESILFGRRRKESRRSAFVPFPPWTPGSEFRLSIREPLRDIGSKSDTALWSVSARKEAAVDLPNVELFPPSLPLFRNPFETHRPAYLRPSPSATPSPFSYRPHSPSPPALLRNLLRRTPVVSRPIPTSPPPLLPLREGSQRVDSKRSRRAFGPLG